MYNQDSDLFNDFNSYSDEWRYYKYVFMNLMRSYQIYDSMMTEFKPSALFIEPSKRCNLRCKYCYAEVENQNNNHVDPEKVFTILKEMPSITDIHVFGGEPLFELDLLKRIRKEYPNKKLFISTNGILLHKLPKELYGIDIQISLEPESFNHRVSVNNESQLSLLKESFNFLRNYTGKVGFTVPVPLYDNIHHIDFIHRIIDSIGRSNVNISWTPLIDPEQKYTFENELKELSDIRKTDLPYYRFILDKSLINYPIHKMLDIHYTYFNCNAGESSVSISPTNKLYLCHEKAITDENDLDIGEVTNKVNINNDKLNKLRLSFVKMNFNKFDSCKECKMKYICKGECHYVKPGSNRCSFYLSLLNEAEIACDLFYKDKMNERNNRVKFLNEKVNILIKNGIGEFEKNLIKGNISVEDYIKEMK